MAAAKTSKEQCVKCATEKSLVRCEGCEQLFCYKHLTDHQQKLSVQLDDIEASRDIFRQTLTEQMNNPNNHPLIGQINQWEKEAIQRIKQTAQQCREMLFQHTTTHFHQIEMNLNKLTDQLRHTRQEKDINEIGINQLKETLTKLSEELQRPSSVSIQRDSTALVNSISIIAPLRHSVSSYPPIRINQKWKQNAVTVAGGNGRGEQFNQLWNPHGIYVDDDYQCIYIADYYNHRIDEWKFDANNGKIVAGGNGQGNRMDQLNQPTDVTVDKKNDSLIICDPGNRRVVEWSRQNGTKGKTIVSDIDCWGITIDNNGNIYVSDSKKNEVRRWEREEKKGCIVAGGNGEGNQLNQLNFPAYLFVDEDYSVYVSDRDNHRVMKWMKGAKEGVIVAGGQRRGSSLSQLYYPIGVVVDQWDNVYLADWDNHRIMCWSKGSKEGGVVVGGNGRGLQSNQLNGPRGISFDRHGNLYVVDWQNNRVQKFVVDNE